MNGMDDNEDETNFSDDGLDALPDNALLELEQNAIQSTQQPAASHLPYNRTLQRPTDYNGAVSETIVPRHLGDGYEDFDVEQFDNEAFNDAGVATPVEEKSTFIPARPPGEMTQGENWRQQRFGRAPPQVVVDQAQHPQHVRHPAQHSSRHNELANHGYIASRLDVEMQDSMLLEENPATRAQTLTSDQEQAFRAQIADLVKERDKLMTDLHEKQSAVLTQRGEISIIRANLGKESKEYQRELGALKKSNQEEVAKYKAVIENANEESRRLMSKKQFLEQDLEEEGRKNRVLQRSLRDKAQPGQADGHTTTPKKPKARPLGDGFDDSEIMAISPTKSGKASRNGTPTAGAKRKRKIDNMSPMPPLVLRPSASLPENEPPVVPQPERLPPVIRKDLTAENNLRFMQKILNHVVPDGKELLIERLTRFSFPSQTARPLSNIVIEATANLSGDTLRSDVLQIFVSLWSRALKEKYYKPIHLLVDMVQFVIASDPLIVTVKLITNMLPVLQTSAEINGVVRFNNAKSTPVVHQNFVQPKQKVKEELNLEVDGTDVLKILYSVACACLHDADKIDRFWRLMSTDFILLFLNSSQPIRDLVLVLNLLSTSIFSKTFGNICGTEDDQLKTEKYIIDRVTYLFWETPRTDHGQRAYTRSEISELRIEAMELLSSLALFTPHPHDDPAHHGSFLLANHPNAIGRLVRCMYDELDALYMHGPGHKMHAVLVNEATRLVYRVLQVHGEKIDMQQKLLAINGGVHKHRVVLCRLAFGEGLLLDAEVEDETVLMARDMLQDAVTPEEGDALVEVFPAHKGRRGNTLE